MIKHLNGPHCSLQTSKIYNIYTNQLPNQFTLQFLIFHTQDKSMKIIIGRQINLVKFNKKLRLIYENEC